MSKSFGLRDGGRHPQRTNLCPLCNRVFPGKKQARQHLAEECPKKAAPTRLSDGTDG